MESLPKKRTKANANHRVVLSEESTRYLDRWLEQLRESSPGIRVKKQDLVNWLITQKGEALSSSDLKSVRDEFYDEIKLAEWALAQLKTAKAKNEKVALVDLLKGGKNGASERPRRTPKKIVKASDLLPQIEQPLDVREN